MREVISLLCVIAAHGLHCFVVLLTLTILTTLIPYSLREDAYGLIVVKIWSTEVYFSTRKAVT